MFLNCLGDLVNKRQCSIMSLTCLTCLNNATSFGLKGQIHSLGLLGFFLYKLSSDHSITFLKRNRKAVFKEHAQVNSVFHMGYKERVICKL